MHSLKFLILGAKLFSRFSQQVSDEGDVLYVFPKDYRSKLAAKSFKIKVEPLFEKAKVQHVLCLFSCFLSFMNLMLRLSF